MLDVLLGKSDLNVRWQRLARFALLSCVALVPAADQAEAQSKKPLKIAPEQIGPVRSGNTIEFAPLSKLSQEDRQKVDRATDLAYKRLITAITRDTGGKLGAIHEMQRISCGFGANKGTSVSSIWVVCSIGHYYCQVEIDDAGGQLNVSGSCGSDAPVPATPASP